ncbi:hypothetical protein NE237_027797 [Protea cynaroides]|uniref:Uncharacterized protein n=1 Tax=Protea cynaroides TaxID=273540 RepID=A0A9Q0GR65_9MAGN|nr:hypothetical protein NE237_027797 [Protea cynaroides]
MRSKGSSYNALTSTDQEQALIGTQSFSVCKFGLLDRAQNMFDEMPLRNCLFGLVLVFGQYVVFFFAYHCTHCEARKVNSHAKGGSYLPMLPFQQSLKVKRNCSFFFLRGKYATTSKQKKKMKAKRLC